MSTEETTPSAAEFVAGLVAEMDELFAKLGERETLEAEAGDEDAVDVPTLLRLALASELEASEVAALWIPTTREIGAKTLLAHQCGDEMKHYSLIADRLRELGEDPDATEPAAEGYSPLYHYLRGLRGTVERIAGGPFTTEAIARVRNAQFIRFCRAVGDETTARLYEDEIQPEEVNHHELARAYLERHAHGPELQRAAADAVRNTLAIADELRTLTEKTTGMRPIPSS